jgi:hypothetical protein
MADAASFDCSKASTAREKLICNTQQLSDDDSQLGEAYKQAMTSLPTDAGKKLRYDEEGWLESLNLCPITGDGTRAIECLDSLYLARIRFLQGQVTRNELQTMVADPLAAETFFESHQPSSGAIFPNLATLGLALDLRLLLPNPIAHEKQIAGLLGSLVPWDVNTLFPNHPPFNYDDSAKSLVPYILAASLNPDSGNPPVSCDLIARYPSLLESTIGGYGMDIDQQLPVVACDNNVYQPGPAELAYEVLLGWNNESGGNDGASMFEYQLRTNYQNWIVYLLPAVLLDTSKYDGVNSNYLRQLHRELARKIALVPSNLNQAPLSASVYFNPDTYQSQPIFSLFPAARTELEKRYESLFGFSKADAQVAAQRGVWLLEDAESWALQGPPDPLAKTILTPAAATPTQQQLQAFNPLSPLAPVYLTDAVLNPQVLALLLQRHPNVNATCGSGITPLMEAAAHDELRSVKLLIAAGANLNASVRASSPPGPWNMCGDGRVVGFLNERGTTALMLAADGAGVDVIRELVVAGANRKAKAQGGVTALGHLDLRLKVQKLPPYDNLPPQAYPTSFLDAAEAAEARRLLTP